LREHGEQGFVAEIQSAYESLLHDRELKIITLKSDHFDLGIPKRWRELMNDAREINRRRS
jgi:hypothetical protein